MLNGLQTRRISSIVNFSPPGRIPHISHIGKDLFSSPPFLQGHVTPPRNSLFHQSSLPRRKTTPRIRCAIERMQKSQDGAETSRPAPEKQLSAAISEDAWNLPLGTADQACKECRRRKAKCNRGIPTCGLCIKYNRHCLYEKHSKTPPHKEVGDLDT